MSNAVTAGMAWTDIAASCYRAYAASTGGKNFRGEPMPAFEDLPEAIQTAWEAAARHAVGFTWPPRAAQCFTAEKLAEREQQWKDWVRP